MPLIGFAQNTPALTTQQAQDLAVVDTYLHAFKNDSAIALSSSLLESLQQNHLENSVFGIRVQLAQAIALEHAQRGEEAIQMLLQIKQLSSRQQVWDVFATACITLGLLYEKINLPKSSLEHLQDAKGYIDRYHLDAIYPHYTLRMASWHRLFGQRDSALYFAKRTIETASHQELFLEQAVGHMLMNILLPATEVETRLQHCAMGLRLYQKIEDYMGCCYMYDAMARIHFQQNAFQKALQYSDSTLASAHQTMLEGNTHVYPLGSDYRLRGAIYKALGQWDSAWVYMQKGYEQDLSLQEKNINDRIVEIDARYNNEKKQEQINAQTLALALKTNQLTYTLVIFGLVSLLALGLFWGFYKQRQSKRALATQNALIQAQAEQLKALNTAKSHFFANISHELRTPLTLLLGPVRILLKEKLLTEKQTRLMQMAERSGNLLGQLINEILDLRKLELGKMTLVTEPTEIRPWFQRYAAQFESLAEQKQIHYHVALNVPDGTVVELDREKCRQILFNLLSNAFKFTAESGQVGVQINLKQEGLEIMVSDTGSGIHQDDLPHVFERFFQTNRPNKLAEGGTGIGLALCQEYAHLFKGTINVDSTLGQGAVFKVTFPVTRINTNNRIAVAPLAETADYVPGGTEFLMLTSVAGASDTPKPTLLLVEDNPDLRDYIRLVLQGKYQVFYAENGQNALDIIGIRASEQKKPITPDLILSDLMMPVMNGYQLLERLKADDATRHIPVIMLTARAETQDKLKALRIGVDDYLTKPFDEEELLARIENLLKNQAIRKQEAVVESGNERPLISQPDRQWLEAFEAHVQKHYASELISVASLAREFAMSESTLLRQLKRLTGLTPLQYLQEVRLEEARHLLENRSYLSVAQVAAQVGYEDTRFFSRSFRQRFGKLPSELLSA